MERLRHEDVEHVWAAMLTSRNKLIQLEHISNGGLVSSLVQQPAQIVLEEVTNGYEPKSISSIVPCAPSAKTDLPSFK